MRWIACALVLATACAGGVTDGQDEDGPGPGEAPEPDAYEPPPQLRTWSTEELVGLGSAIDLVFAAPPLNQTANSAIVVDAETGQVLYQRDPDRVLKPASNTKLLTTALAMSELGADYQIATELIAETDPSAGVVAGDVHLVGHHDFTWSSRIFADPMRPVRELARQAAGAGVVRIDGNLVVRGEFLYQGDNFAYYDAGYHRGQVADRVAAVFADAGISVAGVTISSSLEMPQGTPLGRWLSPPLSVGAAPLNKVSHNEFADILARHLGYTLAGSSDYDSFGSQAVGWLAGRGVDTAGVTFHDGSGLSHDNRISARAIATMLATMLDDPQGEPWQRTFSVGAVDGTLRNRLGESDTAGVFAGKTGTLRDTIALSGILHHRHDGRRYLISLLANAVADSGSTRAAHDRVVSAVAANLRSSLSPLPAPALRSVRWTGDVMQIAWEPVAGADGYLVWFSDDGRTWPRDRARYVGDTTRFYAGELDTAGPLFVRVSAWNGEADGAPSSVLAAARGDGGARILLVDGNQRWLADPAPENHLDRGHDFAAAYAFDLAPTGFDSAGAEAVRSTDVSLSDYDAVFWMLGEESEADDTFAMDEQIAVEAYAASGGNLFVSGAEIGWDLVERGGPGDADFMRETLKADYLGDDAGTYATRPTGALEMSDEPVMFFHPALLDVAYPDELAPTGGAETLLRYDTGAAAGVAYQGSYRVITLGFPLEAVAAPGQRSRLISAALRYFEI